MVSIWKAPTITQNWLLFLRAVPSATTMLSGDDL